MNHKMKIKNKNLNYKPIINSSITETNDSDISIEDKIGDNVSFNIKNKKILIRFIVEIITLIYLFIGRYLYILSLKGCSGTEYDCLFDIKYIIDDINNCVRSTLYFIFVLFLIHMNFCSKYYIILIFVFFAEFIIRDHDSTFLNHGILNLLGFFVILFFGEIIIIIIVLFCKLYKYKNKIPFIISIIIFTIFSFIIVFKNKDNFFCKDWDKGLNNTYIDNNISKYPCKMKIPKSKCFINIVRPFLDATKFAGINCKKRQEKEKYLLKNFLNITNNTNIKRIGYPITIGKEPEILGKPAMYSNSLLQFVKNNLINMDN